MSARILSLGPTTRASALGNTGFGPGCWSSSLCTSFWPTVPTVPDSGAEIPPLGARLCWSPFLPLHFQSGLPGWLGTQSREVLFLTVPFTCPRAPSWQSCLTYRGIVLCVRPRCQRQLWPDLSAAPSLRNLEPRQPRVFTSPVIYIKAMLSSSVMQPGVTG